LKSEHVLTDVIADFEYGRLPLFGDDARMMFFSVFLILI
jgi:hypothetical protein